MPTRFVFDRTREGKKASIIVTFMLVPLDDSDVNPHEAVRSHKPLSFAEQMRSSEKTYVIFYNEIIPEEIKVDFEEIIQDSLGIDFEKSVLRITTSYSYTKSVVELERILPRS